MCHTKTFKDVTVIICRKELCNLFIVTNLQRYISKTAVYKLVHKTTTVPKLRQVAFNHNLYKDLMKHRNIP